MTAVTLIYFSKGPISKSSYTQEALVDTVPFQQRPKPRSSSAQANFLHRPTPNTLACEDHWGVVFLRSCPSSLLRQGLSLEPEVSY